MADWDQQLFNPMKILPWFALPMVYIAIVVNHQLFYASFWS